MLVTMAGGVLPGQAADTAQPASGTAVVSDWGAHNYVAADGEQVTTTLTPNPDGSLQFSGDQVAAGNSVGMTYTSPLYLDQRGFSLRFSLDQFDPKSGDKWYAIGLIDQKTVTNEQNAEPVFKQWDTADALNAKYAEGRGFIVFIRPHEDGWMTLEYRYYGVTSASDATPADKGHIYAGDGGYDNIRLDSRSFSDIRMDFVKRQDGGYDLIFNDGAFTRVDGTGSQIERIPDNGTVNPHVKFNLIDSLFPTGTPAYLKIAACNEAVYEMKFSVQEINGRFANRENTLDSWGVHNYTTADGSVLENEIAADAQGGITVSGIQAAGEGELGVTYARPIYMTNGFSVDFSLDQYKINGVNGVDSWISLQLSDKMQVTDANNSTPIYHKMDAGNGDPAYGSGLVMLLRPLENNVLGIGEIFWNGVKFTPEGAVREKNWQGDADGCYAFIKLDSFAHIKLAITPNGSGGFDIQFNDGNYLRCADASGTVMEGQDTSRINPANGYANLGVLFNKTTPAYLSLVYHHNVDSEAAAFTVHTVNGVQAAPNTEETWGAHDYACISGPSILTDTALDGKGGISFSGTQTAGDGGIGLTYLRPIDMANGVSVELSLDEYSVHKGGREDSFLALQLMDKAEITDANNPDPVYRRFEANGNPAYGSGLVILVRPMENHVLGIGEIYWNGVKFTPEVSKETNWQIDANGCYAAVKVDSFQHIKFAFKPAQGGAFHIVINDGQFIRMNSTTEEGQRQADDYGRINVANGYNNLSRLFSNHNPAYLGVIYKAEAGIPAKVTIHKVDGLNAAPAGGSDDNDEVVKGVYELFDDTKFEKGFSVTGMDSPTNHLLPPYYFNYGDNSLRPKWTLAQWDSKIDFRDENETIFSSPDDNVYIYENDTKKVTVDTNTGEIGLQLNASAVYDAPRKDGERWPHLLISQDMNSRDTQQARQLKNVDHLRLTLSQKLTKFEDHMDGQANSGLHAASMYIYLYVKGINEQGRTEMTWFGLPLFDNRYPFPGETGMQDGGKDDASGLFIYLTPSQAFTNTSFTDETGTPVGSEDNAWMDIDIDLKPFIERALALANEKGFMKGVTMDTVYLDGMNLGWEMPGTYDAEMLIKNLSLKAYVDEEYENTTAFHNLFVPNMQETETVVIDNQLQFQLPKDVLDVDGIETSMLTLQGKARTDTSGDHRAPAGRVTAVYDTNLLVNGMRYNYAYDKPAVMIYTLDETQAAAADKLRYYAMDDAGTLTELTGVYNTADRTVTFSLENIQNFVVVNTAAAAPDDNPETGVGTAAGALALVAAAGAAVCVCCTKRKNR